MHSKMFQSEPQRKDNQLLQMKTQIPSEPMETSQPLSDQPVYSRWKAVSEAQGEEKILHLYLHRTNSSSSLETTPPETPVPTLLRTVHWTADISILVLYHSRLNTLSAMPLSKYKQQHISIITSPVLLFVTTFA